MKAEIEKLKLTATKWQLKRLTMLLKIADEIPHQFFEELKIVFVNHSEILKRMGYLTFDELVKEPWLLRFYAWSAKTSKVDGQKLSLGGKMLELVVKNDQELHSVLERWTLRRYQELKETNLHPVASIGTPRIRDHFIRDINDFVVVKATDLTSGGGLFLDFAYLLFNEKTGKVIVVIEGQIKREGAVRNYRHQAVKDSGRFFADGFEFFWGNRKISVAASDIMIDELHGSKILVRSTDKLIIGRRTFLREIINPPPGLAGYNEIYHEFVAMESRVAIDNMLESLFKAKARTYN